MSLINIVNLTFAYDGSYDNIFENTSFQMDTDWKLGFTGRNGRGKTTFLNLLQKKMEYRGSISASVVFEYFPYTVTDNNVHTIDIFKEICATALHWEVLRELSLLNVAEDVLHREFCTLSNGEQTKILLIAMFLKQNSFLLIDEPTNHLDMEGRRVLGEYLKSKKGFLLVSHDRVFLDCCIDHVLSINKTNIEVQSGNFSSWFHNKELQDNFEIGQNEKLKKDIKRLEKTAKEKSEWSDKAEKTKIGREKYSGQTVAGSRGYIGSKTKKLMKRSKVLEARMENDHDEKSKLLKNLEDSEPLKLSPLRFHTSNLLALNDIAISYGDVSVCKGINFTVEEGDRIALIGKNGSGKTSILKIILGEEIPHSGSVLKNHQLKISYVSQSTEHLKGNLTEYALMHGIDESLFKAILRKLDFSRVQFEKPMERFSGGQKKKVLIARSLCEKAHLYIWDEPLNFIDVLSRMQIESLLLTYAPTILFVEHDRAFCNNIATKTILL